MEFHICVRIIENDHLYYFFDKKEETEKTSSRIYVKPKLRINRDICALIMFTFLNLNNCSIMRK